MEHPVEEAIKVVVRVKPFTTQEIEETGAQSCLAVVGDTVTVLPTDDAAASTASALQASTAPSPAHSTPSSTPTRTPTRAMAGRVPALRLAGATTATTPRRSNAQRLGTPSSIQRTRGVPKTFTFDKVFDPTATQQDVYLEVDPLVQAVVEGHNSTIFAYGQTGSGKTHTMLGTSRDPGVIPRAVDRLFQLVEERKEMLFVVRCSFVELHMDHFNDLLDASSHPSTRSRQLPSSRTPAPLELHEDGRTGRVYLTGSPSLDTTVTSKHQALRLIEQGARLRTVASTQMNHISSRSHAILTFYIESRLSSDPNAPVTMAKLHLVDLAGSERLARSQAEGSTKKETQNINSSLSALGDCLAALTNGKAEHIPYRNSKLTRLLADSLGGNSHTLFIVNVQQGPSSYPETLSSLLYAQRAKMIKNHISINRDLFGCSDLQALQGEITRLKQHLHKRTLAYQAIRKQQVVVGKENEILRSQLAALSALNMREKDVLEQQMGQVIHSTGGEMAEQQQEFLQLQASLDRHSKTNHDLMVRLAVGEGDNLDLAQQLKGAQHEAAHARWERDRATHALAKMRKKLQTAQSAWEEERSVVQARILELEELLDKACTELKQRRKVKPQIQQQDLSLSLENEKKQVRILLAKYKKLKETATNAAHKYEEDLAAKEGTISELRKALARAGHEERSRTASTEPEEEAPISSAPAQPIPRRTSGKRHRTDEDSVPKAGPSDQGNGRGKKRSKHSPEAKDELHPNGKGISLDGGTSAELQSANNKPRKLMPRISGMVDRKAMSGLGPLTRALLAKQVTLPRLKASVLANKENASTQNHGEPVFA